MRSGNKNPPFLDFKTFDSIKNFTKKKIMYLAQVFFILSCGHFILIVFLLVILFQRFSYEISWMILSAVFAAQRRQIWHACGLR